MSDSKFKTTMLYLITIGLVGIIIAAFVGLIVANRNYTKTICKQFGDAYEYRYGERSPDICINNSNGEVRYP